MTKFKVVKFKISQLQKEKMTLDLELLAVLFAATFTSVFLPQLLFRYIYANQQLTAEPKLLEYIPLAAFVVGAVYFVYAVIANIQKSMQIKNLRKEMMDMSMMDGGSCCSDCKDCNCDEHGNCACGTCDMDGMHNHSHDMEEKMSDMGSVSMNMDKPMTEKKTSSKKKAKQV